jgi:hypothetical protein
MNGFTLSISDITDYLALRSVCGLFKSFAGVFCLYVQQKALALMVAYLLLNTILGVLGEKRCEQFGELDLPPRLLQMPLHSHERKFPTKLLARYLMNIGKSAIGDQMLRMSAHIYTANDGTRQGVS